MSLPHFDVFHDLLLNRSTATGNLVSALYNEETKNVNGVICMSVLILSRLVQK